MTDDELDLLASAYVDGEATSDEVALVEGDPELLARVTQLRAISDQVAATPAPPDTALKQQHLAAAMAEFSAITARTPAARTRAAQSPESQSPESPGPESQSPIPSLAEKRRDREARKAQRSMPQWLPAAAAFILIGGGVIFLAGRTGSDDSTESATEASADADDSAGSSAARAESAFEQSDATDDDASDEAMEEDAMADDAMEDNAIEDDAMEDEAMEEAATAVEGEIVPDDDVDQQSTPTPSTTTGGFFPGEPVREYDQIPEIEGLLADLPAPRTDLLESRCGLELDDRLDLEVVGYLPIAIAGAPAEVFAVLTQDGSDSAVIVDESCEQLAPRRAN